MSKAKHERSPHSPPSLHPDLKRRYPYLAFTLTPPPDTQPGTRRIATRYDTWYSTCHHPDRQGQACIGLTGSTIVTPERYPDQIIRIDRPAYRRCTICPRRRQPASSP